MHTPVMLKETIDRLAPKRGGAYLDCTLGDGGHSGELLRRVGGDCRLLALDRDAEAISRASANLAEFMQSVTMVHCNHADAGAACDRFGFGELDGAMIDTGVSSEQLDEADRGFSFMHDGPLDMRMDRSRGASAAEVLATMDRDGLEALLREKGEEPDARRIATAIIEERKQAPIETTARLVEIVEKALGGAARARRRHPATRVFQALRMEVNGELESLEAAIEAILPRLKKDGRIAVITFESISDRLVKRLFAAHAGREVSLQQGGSEWRGEEPRIEKLDRHAVAPTQEETAGNPRARSAKLRAAKRI